MNRNSKQKKRNQQIKQCNQMKYEKLYVLLYINSVRKLQIIIKKMYNNQRHIIMSINQMKDKANKEKPNHLDKQFGHSYQSTICDDDQYSQSFNDVDLTDDSEYQGEEIKEQQGEKEDERPFVKEYFYTVRQQQIRKEQFLSAAKLYQHQVLQKYLHSITHHNYFFKCYQTNLKQRTTKLYIIKQLLYPKQQTRFTQIKQKIDSSPICRDKIDEMQITFFKCECQFVTILQKSFKQHLKQNSHKAYLCIQTKKQRRNQQRFYKTLLSDDGEMVYFNPFWLYQSFEVIFIQGGVHWQLDSIKRSILAEMSKVKIQHDKMINQLDSIETMDVDLKKRWKKIYIQLHKVHKGNQRICHKCMIFDQHLYLFALAIMQTIKKSQLIFGEKEQQEKKKFSVFSKLIRIILMGFLDRNFHNQVNAKSNIPKLLEYQSIRKMVLKLLKSYIQTFDYIDLYDFSTTCDQL